MPFALMLNTMDHTEPVLPTRPFPFAWLVTGQARTLGDHDSAIHGATKNHSPALRQWQGGRFCPNRMMTAPPLPQADQTCTIIPRKWTWSRRIRECSRWSVSRCWAVRQGDRAAGRLAPPVEHLPPAQGRREQDLGVTVHPLPAGPGRQSPLPPGDGDEPDGASLEQSTP